VMKGYWNRPDETAIALRADDAGRTWLYTGDVARMDEDGYTYIVQRKKDLIIVSGFNVYPSEVEGVLYTHPAVMEAGVIGFRIRTGAKRSKRAWCSKAAQPQQTKNSSRTARLGWRSSRYRARLSSERVCQRPQSEKFSIAFCAKRVGRRVK